MGQPIREFESHRFRHLQRLVKVISTSTRLSFLTPFLDRFAAAADAGFAVSAYRNAVLETASELAEHHLELLIEPINRRDLPGYFLDDFAFAQQLIRELALRNLKLQFDIYHRQILHGDV